MKITPRTSRFLRNNFVWATKAFNFLTGGAISEPFCSRVYRNHMADPGSFWTVLVELIDELFPEDEHCRKAHRAWAMEVKR